MKIVRIIARLNIGGPAIQAVLLTRALAAGHEALLLAGTVPAGEGDMSYAAAAAGVRPLYLATLSRRVSALDDLRAFLEIFRLLRRERPDLVHTHTAKAGALGRVAAWLTRTPCVHTYHGHVFRGYFSPAKTRCIVAIERLLARLCDRVVTISASQRREIVDEFAIAPAAKVAVIRLGFDLQPFAEVAARRDYAALATVGWVGRLTEIKDPEKFVEVAEQFSRATPRFRMIGDGELRARVETALRRSCGTRVELLGWQRDMAAVYDGLDALVLTSRNEGTPVAVIEAMAAGCCVVAADVGGVRDLFGGAGRVRAGYTVFENGILVHEASAAVYAAALRELAGDSALRQAMGQSASHAAQAGYGSARLTREILELYEAVLAERGRSLPARRAQAAGGVQ